jgi:hypothetical protein
MRLLLLAVAFSLWTCGVRAETWRVLHWDKFNFIAVDVDQRRTTGLSNPAFPFLELTLYTGLENTGAQLSDVKAKLTEQEVDCEDQRVRTRSRESVAGSGPEGAATTEIERWRDPGEERDRLLVWAVCNPSNIQTLPMVTASVEEARQAQLTAATDPKVLAAAPAWSGAWNTMVRATGPDGIATILVQTLAQHPFVVAAIDDGGASVLLSTDIQTVGDMRYRFHQARVGGPPRDGAAAIWLMQEADCSGRRLRNLAWAGFDDQMHKKFGYDTTYIGTPFQTPAPGTPDAIMLQDVCAASQVIPGLPVVQSDLLGAIAARRWLFEGDEAAKKTARDPEAWHDAYEQACAIFHCAPAGARAPSGPGWPKGSPS